MSYLGGADQESQAALGVEQPGGDGKGGIEAFDRAQRDHIERSGRQGFGARILYIDVHQCKEAGNLAKKGGFLMVRLDEGDGDGWRPELDGKAGEAGARAQIGKRGGPSNRQALPGWTADGGRPWKQITGQEKAFAEVSGYDLFGVADRR